MHNRNTIIITVVVMVVILISSLLYYSSHFNVRSVPVISKVRTLDKFGILEIYPTKIGGREWFINMEKPTLDGLFNPQSNISRQLDGSWRVGQKQTSGKFNEEVRMYSWHSSRCRKLEKC